MLLILVLVLIYYYRLDIFILIKNNNILQNMSDSFLSEEQIWGSYGKVLNPKTLKYVRIGSPQSMTAIYNLEHNDEWKKRVDYIIENHGIFGKKLDTYLQKKIK